MIVVTRVLIGMKNFGMKNLRAKVYGAVQGIGFRFEAKILADKLDLKGFARNEPDGSVYIEAEGDEKNLKKFLEWCREGPSLANVKRVEQESDGNIKNFDGFEVR
jgi:acylphosphatase